MDNTFLIDPKVLDISVVILTLKANYPNADTKKINAAYNYASQKHKGVYRKSGEEYITHPLYVAYLCAAIKLDETSVITALLHDCLEDTNATYFDIRLKFGKTVATLVSALTNIKKITKSVTETNTRNLSRLLLASNNDIRVILIKLSDRLHNMLTIDALQHEKQVINAKETINFFSPIAEYVGMYSYRKILDDLSFKVLYPDEYAQIQKYLIDERYIFVGGSGESNKHATDFMDNLKKLLKKQNILFDINARTKSIYSIYRKILKKFGVFKKEYIDSIIDIIGIRIIVKTEEDVYRVVGIINSKYITLEDNFSDYFVKPKVSGYKAVHLVVNDNTGNKFEIHVTTEYNNWFNQYGPAAHIFYKSQEKYDIDDNILSRLNIWKKDNFYRIDVFKNKIYVLSPKGDVTELPKGAVVLDFAFMVHTEIGLFATGAKVNGKFCSITEKLNTGDIVEILTDKRKKSINIDLVRTVKTNLAKRCIRKSISISELDSLQHIEETEENDNHGKIDIYKYISRKKRTENRIQIENNTSDYSVEISSMSKISYCLAQCCNPTPNDRIVSILTFNRGMVVHKHDCKNISGKIKNFYLSEWVKTTKN